MKSLRLKPGAGKAVAVKVRSLPPVAAGTYYVLATVTGPDGRSSQGPASSPVSIVPAVVALQLTAKRPRPAGAGRRR